MLTKKKKKGLTKIRYLIIRKGQASTQKRRAQRRRKNCERKERESKSEGEIVKKK